MNERAPQSRRPRPVRRAAAQTLAGLVAAATLVGSGGAAVASSPGVSDRVVVASRSQPLVVAHRGASAVAPENTIPALRAAVRAGADMVEFDVQRTADGHLVVVHDLTFARTTNVASVFPGRENDLVSTFTWAEVKQLDAGSWFGPRFAGTKVPSLRAFLRAAQPQQVGLLLELKNPQLYPGYEAQVAALLRHVGFVDSSRVWIHSFDATSLETIHDLLPTVPVGLISRTAVAPAADQSWLSTVNTTDSAVTDARVDAAGGLGIPVIAWPASGRAVNAGQIERLVDDGVSGIITDRPGAARQVLGGG